MLHVASLSCEELGAQVDDLAVGGLDPVDHLVEALGVGLFADRLGHLLLEVRIGVDDVPLVIGIAGWNGVGFAHR